MLFFIRKRLLKTMEKSFLQKDVQLFFSISTEKRLHTQTCIRGLHIMIQCKLQDRSHSSVSFQTLISFHSSHIVLPFMASKQKSILLHENEYAKMYKVQDFQNQKKGEDKNHLSITSSPLSQRITCNCYQIPKNHLSFSND